MDTIQLPQLPQSNNSNEIVPVTPFMIRVKARMRKVRKFLYTHLWIPMSKAYNTIHDFFNKVWTEWNRTNATSATLTTEVELSTNTTSVSSSSPSSPKSPTSIHIDCHIDRHIDTHHEDMEIHNRISERPTTNNTTNSVDITATIERELSEVSVMKISHSNSISSLIRENYVDSSGNADEVSL